MHDLQGNDQDLSTTASRVAHRMTPSGQLMIMSPNGAPAPAGSPLAAEFFAGIGLVRSALERAGFAVAFANDIEPAKRAMYASNFSDDDFLLGDVRAVTGDDVPTVSVATASFPCTDLSLAGNRAGLAGDESSMFWEFARILEEMDERRPTAVMLENVPSFATSHDGADLRNAIARLNDLDYICDVLVVDARRFVPQSRPRLFVVGSQEPIAGATDFAASALRPPWVERFVAKNRDLRMQAAPLEPPPTTDATLVSIVERMRSDDARWWDPDRVALFLDSLSAVQSARLAELRAARRTAWATAYRRTRGGRAVWEIRPDAISGCLRTARGGSSKQALVEAGSDEVRVRWMTPREYARLQGAPNYRLGRVSDNQALFGFGDAVCVPVIEWIAANYLRPLLDGTLASVQPALVEAVDG